MLCSEDSPIMYFLCELSLWKPRGFSWGSLSSCTRGCIMGTKRYRPSWWMGNKGKQWEDRRRNNNWYNYVGVFDGFWRMSWKTDWCSWDFYFESWYHMIKFEGNGGVSSALWLLSVIANCSVHPNLEIFKLNYEDHDLRWENIWVIRLVPSLTSNELGSCRSHPHKKKLNKLKIIVFSWTH